MNKKKSHKIINIILLVTMFSHLTFFHEYFQDYVICFGNDGHITIENLDDCNECSGLDYFDLFSSTQNVIIEDIDCKDIALDDNCFEDETFITKNKVLFANNLLKTKPIIINFEIDLNKRNHYILVEKFKNPITEIYSTVSLII